MFPVRALRACVFLFTSPAAAQPSYLNLGWIAQEADNTGSSNTLEYAYDDGVLGNLAALLGFPEDAATFLNRSQLYRYRS